MLLKLVLILNLQCLIHIAKANKNEPNERVDLYQLLLEKTYSSEDIEVKEDCGEPLFLTPLIEADKLEEARIAAIVDPKNFLPGVKSYSGYLTVDKKYNANLWFWYFPVMGKTVAETPLIIWLQGGPGASSMYGLFVEIGPFSINAENKVEEMKHSWSKNHSLLFFDNPVGTGFSFADDKRGYATNQTTIGENLYTALQQFMKMFPELRQAPLIIAGESYAGKHIPSLGIQIHWHKNTDEHINLQGMAIGNGFIDPVSLMRCNYFVREVGLVDDATADIMKKYEEDAGKSIVKADTVQAFDDYMTAVFYLQYASRLPNAYNILDDNDELAGSYRSFLQQPEIRRALHVGNISFSNVGEVYAKLVPDLMNSAKSWVEELLNHYRIMVYNGHLDTVVPYHASVNTYNSLVFSGAEKYKTTTRRIWIHEKKLAGYFKEAGNFLEVMVRGAGHMVPVEKSSEALALISAFALNMPLESPVPDDPILGF